MLKSNVGIAILQMSVAMADAFLGREFDGDPCAGRFAGGPVELFRAGDPYVR